MRSTEGRKKSSVVSDIVKADFSIEVVFSLKQFNLVEFFFHDLVWSLNRSVIILELAAR